MRRTNKKGFTIVELVIVIAVIAILAAVLIPTFASLVNKANISADEQAVKQMNTILLSELVSKDDISIAEVQKVLKENGVDADSYTPMTNGYAFYFDTTANCIILVSDESKVVYPADMASKYSKTTEILATWKALNSNTRTPVSVEDAAGFISAAEDADGKIITLPKNETITLTSDQIASLNGILDEGKTISVDLNGSTLTASVDNNQIDVLDVTQQTTLEIKNGKLEAEQINVQGGAALVLDNVEYTSKIKDEGVTAIYAANDACQVFVLNSKIFASMYGVATNNIDSKNVYIEIANSKIEAIHPGADPNDNNKGYVSIGVMVNVADARVNIFDSEISGTKMGLYVRLGTVKVQNSTIERLNYEHGDWDKYVTQKSPWKSGTSGAPAAVVVGDNSGNYAGNAKLTISGSTIKAEDHKVVVSKDSNTTPEFVYDESVSESDIYRMDTTTN